uniref:Uncharacterized protein n=1 Tax=Magallana gigas TaxID=29159 RepID=K1PA26_MAGGI
MKKKTKKFKDSANKRNKKLQKKKVVPKTEKHGKIPENAAKIPFPKKIKPETVKHRKISENAAEVPFPKRKEILKQLEENRKKYKSAKQKLLETKKKRKEISKKLEENREKYNKAKQKIIETKKKNVKCINVEIPLYVNISCIAEKKITRKIFTSEVVYNQVDVMHLQYIPKVYHA